ncbi:hypothetical protein QN372_19280 [Undibacterium sp. RTI2.1]|uniref:hypothetical protein n=1 Tax=unclassified Undibacterium TaxID=2630295 RepID=UPI002B22EAF5|nr:MULTISPECIES: hypothetical protein [unclassified Undibacterium]MEB0032896.1 hypothetical protein [Undibacterium sp. RTI2.1]MEB0118801.1 hypothetical protein [Undibacterium sp. RTI2.2]
MNTLDKVKTANEDIPVTMALLAFVGVLRSARQQFLEHNQLSEALKLPIDNNWYQKFQDLFYSGLKKEAELIGLKLNRITFETIMDLKVSDEVMVTSSDDLAKFYVFNEWSGIRKISR